MVDILKDYLCDEGELNRTLAQPKDALDEREKEALARLYEHFIGGKPAGRKRRRTQNESKADDNTQNSDDDEQTSGSLGGWKRVMNLQTLVLPEHITTHISAHGADAAKFLNLVTDNASDQQVSAFTDPRKVSDALMARVSYARKCCEQLGMIEMQLAFTYLFFYDLIKMMWPNHSGHRVGHIMLKKIRDFLKPIRGDGDGDGSDNGSDSGSTTAPRINIDFTAKEINEWVCLGSKIETLTREHGEGCIFFLASLPLSRDFLKHKFSGSGTYYESAMIHLHSLDLLKKTEESGAGVLGANIRALMLCPFRRALARQKQAERADSGLGLSPVPAS